MHGMDLNAAWTSSACIEPKCTVVTSEKCATIPRACTNNNPSGVHRHPPVTAKLYMHAKMAEQFATGYLTPKDKHNATQLILEFPCYTCDCTQMLEVQTYSGGKDQAATVLYCKSKIVISSTVNFGPRVHNIFGVGGGGGEVMGEGDGGGGAVDITHG